MRSRKEIKTARYQVAVSAISRQGRIVVYVGEAGSECRGIVVQLFQIYTEREGDPGHPTPGLENPKLRITKWIVLFCKLKSNIQTEKSSNCKPYNTFCLVLYESVHSPTVQHLSSS
jgi:hypothetical protein